MAAGRGGYNSPALTIDSPTIAMDFGRGGYNGPSSVSQNMSSGLDIQQFGSLARGGNGNGGDDSGRGGYN